jgi:sulfate adenylyltransferase subunit 1
MDMDLLRFTTAGSVDDGKSTLIGRLLYDSKSIRQDQLAAVEESSLRRGDENINLALLTDGLRAERAQGITIDVAYLYFSTSRRKFIIADTPGHIQYTRNMVTGASTANLAVVLVDARKGVIEQTCRHAFIANLLRIKHVVVAVNKMDLVDYKQDLYNEIVEAFQDFALRLDNIAEITFIPISALRGDNVVDKSENMPWYDGSSLLYHLETVCLDSEENHVDARFPVQWVIRPQSDTHHDFRGYAGRVAGGVFKPGDEVVVLPSGFSTHVSTIESIDGKLKEAFSPLSVAMTLNDEFDISRGDMIVKPNNPPSVDQDIEVMICWFSERPMVPRGKYLLRHTTNEVKAVVTTVRYKVNVNTLDKIENDLQFHLNDIGRVSLRTSAPLFFDRYFRNRHTGSLILIDEQTNETVAAGIIV